jgi:serine protease AprX
MAKRRSPRPRRAAKKRASARRPRARVATRPPDAPANPSTPPPPSTPAGGDLPAPDPPSSVSLASDKLPARERMHRDMMRSVLTEPLLSKVLDDKTASFDVIISLNELFDGGIQAALAQVQARATEWNVPWTSTSHYVFGRLPGTKILELAAEARALMAKGKSSSVVYRIWEDSDVEPTLTRTLTTIKADAAQRAFQALGQDIVWAVLDSGIDGRHDHFRLAAKPQGKVETLDVPVPLRHLDFTPDGQGTDGAPSSDRATVDRFGHGTHVAGIIAGEWESSSGTAEPVVGTEVRDEATDTTQPTMQTLARISGVAPRCKLLSLKVVADTPVADRQTAGMGKVSWILRAIDQIQEWNQHGKRLVVHGVNMSLGYPFDARWFGCGQSPLCVEVNRLVKSGVVVVVSAGNDGYPRFLGSNGKAEPHYLGSTITDPGNAALAITVGATHRDSPHLYGVSFFSSRGPTGDGRLKPDLLAPGERIWSCAAGKEAGKYSGLTADDGSAVQVLYLEQTGTSMAAPHVSGAIAAFLSVRREFIGQPERVKEIVLAAAVDLKRDRYVQGAGLLDLMKMLQLV